MSVQPSAPPRLGERIVSLDKVSRAFGRVNAVNNVSLTVTRNETFALLGPNGSGKSTLLNMICGNIQPSLGDIRIGRHSIIKAASAAKSLLSYVPDESELYGHMTVREFLLFMAGIKGATEIAAADCVSKGVARLNLGSVLDNKIATLSRGFRQRVAIAQALLNEPEVILLDEPSNGLDPVQLRDWRVVMKELSNQATVIFTSHVLDDVVALANRVGLLVDGELRTIVSLERGTSRDDLEQLFFAALSA